MDKPAGSRNGRKLALILLVVSAIALYLAAGGDALLDPKAFQTQYQASPQATIAGFVLICLVGTAVSLPVTGVLAVIGGMTFGHLLGVTLTLLACTLGGTLAFLMSRYVLKGPVQRRFASQLALVNRGVEKDGAFYLFGLRMIPVIPFWLLNLLAALTPIDVRRFLLATLAGMLPIVLTLVHFGTQTRAVEEFSASALLSPGLLLSLALVGALPFVARGIVWLVRRIRHKDDRAPLHRD